MAQSGKTDLWVLTLTTIVQNAKNAAPVSGTRNGSTVTSTFFDNIPILGAKSITVQVLNTGGSTDMDVNVHTSCDGTNFDGGDVADGTVTAHPYTSMNFDGETVSGYKSFPVTPGPSSMKIRIDENNVASVTGTINVLVVWSD